MPSPSVSRWCLLATALLAVSSCSGANEGTSDAGTRSDGPDLQTPSDVESVVFAESGFVRLGEGRALGARYSPVADRLVVVTTSGLAVSDGWGGAPTEISRPSTDVGSAALSSDGERFAVVAEADDGVEIWDLDPGALSFVVPLAAGSEVVRSLTYPVQGDDVIVGTSQSVARWSPIGERTTLLAAAPGASLTSVAVSLLGDQLVAVESDGNSTSLLQWVESSGATSLPLALGADRAVERVELMSDRSSAVVEVRSSVDAALDELVVVDLASGSQVSEPIGAGLLVGALWALSADDHVAVADPATLTVIDIDGVVAGMADLSGLPPVRSLSASVDGFVTSHADGSIGIWGPSASQRTQLAPSVGPLREVSTPDDRSIVTVGQDGRVDSWDVSAGSSNGLIERYASGAVNSVEFAPDASRIVVARATGDVDVVDVASGATGLRLDHQGRNVDSAAFDPDGVEIVTGVGERIGPEAFDDSVNMWDALNGDRVAQVGGEGESVAGCGFFVNLVRFSPDGQLVAASSHDFTVGLYDADDLSLVTALKPHGSTVLDVAFSPDGRLLATSSEDWTLRVWSVAEGELIGEYDAAVGGYRSMAFAPDGSAIATVGATGEVSLIGTDDGQLRSTFESLANWSSNLEFSRDGSLIAAGGRDGGVSVWRVSDGSVLQHLEVPGALVNSVALSPDATLLVAGTDDGTLRQWSLDR